MAKILRCADLGMSCPKEIRAETEEEVLKLVAEHAKEVHGTKEVSPEVVEKVRAVMHEE